ncbi:hypothetical protein LZ32DRAFT_456820 [Colletotrichum eremochloae]|nr:hypothetical protein LZ32DRAFT_456820 [Colletotrichum eremochloae]
MRKPAQWLLGMERFVRANGSFCSRLPRPSAAATRLSRSDGPNLLVVWLQIWVTPLSHLSRLRLVCLLFLEDMQRCSSWQAPVVIDWQPT